MILVNLNAFILNECPSMREFMNFYRKIFLRNLFSLKPILKKATIVLFVLLICDDFSAQSFELNWSYLSTGRIVAQPNCDSHNLYVGNEKGDFYSINIMSGEVLWKVETKGSIQARAVLYDNIIFFESANIFYAVNKEDGSEIWKYSLGIEPEKFSYGEIDYLFKLDFFDDKRSSGFIEENVVYIGTTDGRVLGLRVQTGEVEFAVLSENQSPIRSTPIVRDGKIYFGDWNGIVYCYSLNTKRLLWQKSTYREKPYETFGGDRFRICHLWR